MSKISALTAASTPTVNDVFAVVNGGSTKSMTLSQIFTTTTLCTTLTASTSVVTPVIDSGTTGSLSLKTNNGTVGFAIQHTASAVNHIEAFPNAAASSPGFISIGSDTNVGMDFYSKGASDLTFNTGSSSANRQLYIVHTAGTNRVLTITGGASGSGTHAVLNVTGGDLQLSSGTADIRWGKAAVALGGGATATMGTIGGSGPAASAQVGWLRVITSTGAVGFLPYWS